jgi:uncharacterized protein (DUF362 family)/Pyruvate/2-oxoacid:ferredoxin oxidoreductase delta subunit
MGTVAKVSIVRCDDYSLEEVERAVAKSLRLIGGIEDIIDRGDKVLLKPNLVMPKPPEKGVTTHPAVLKALSKIILDVGASIAIGDSSAGAWDTAKALRVCGIYDLCESINVRALNFDERTPVKIECPTAKILQTFYMAQAVRDADVVVTVPKLKVHELMMFTGAVKNLFGAVPGWYKMEIHKRAPDAAQFGHALIDIYSSIRPKLALMDGVVTVDGSSGPGPVRKVGVILASTDPLALDTVASQLVGYSPERLPLNKAAKRHGFDACAPANIEVLGEPLESVQVRDFRKPQRFLRFLVSRAELLSLLRVRPKFILDSAKCAKCGLCAESCPGRAITMRPKPVFDPRKCIYCFCCREVCAQDAIGIRHPWLVRKIGEALASR